LQYFVYVLNGHGIVSKFLTKIDELTLID